MKRSAFGAWSRPVQPAMIGGLTLESLLTDLERAYGALEWVDHPEASYARRLLSRLGERARGGESPPPRVREAGNPSIKAPWE